MKTCTKCKLNLPTTDFTKAKKSKDRLSYECKKCRRNYFLQNKERYYALNKRRAKELTQMRMLYVLNYAKKKGCADCGEDDPRVLEFDHVRGEKYRNVSRMVQDNLSMEKIQEEIDKCDIRCANCHKIKTIKQLGFYHYIDFNSMTLKNQGDDSSS